MGGKTNDGKIKSVVQINFDKSTAIHCEDLSELRCFHKGYMDGKVGHIVGGGTDSIECYDV